MKRRSQNNMVADQQIFNKEKAVRNGRFFYLKDKTPYYINNMYEGESCFLFSNGPSITSGYYNLELLKNPGIQIMSVNNGASTLLKIGITPDFWTCVDEPSRFVRQIWFNSKIIKFVPFCLMNKTLWDNEKWCKLNTKVRDCSNVVGYFRNGKFEASKFFKTERLNWGCDEQYGGCRSVLLTAIRILQLLGFKEIFLLGVDMTMSKSNKYHFEEGRTPHAVRNNKNTYRRFINEYGPEIEKESRKIGFKIYNCNPESRLRCFEFADFHDVANKISKKCEPVHEIQTEGMYVAYKHKVRMDRNRAVEFVKNGER